MKKLLLLLGLVVSATAMAGVAEVRIGGDLTNRATFKDTDNSTWRINKDALKRGFEITKRNNFKNDSEVTPYVKGNLGVAFNSGKIEIKEGPSSVKFKYNSGIYYGIGAGIQYKNFVTDLSYNINSLKTKLDVDLPGYKANNKFNTNHGALTLSVGYSFGL